MQEMTPLDFFKNNEFFEFIKNTFKEGTVPEDPEEFMACFSNNTTDGSLCFAYQFGKGEDDAVMLFFYPTFCAVPPRYNKNMRRQEECNVGLTNLEYQSLIIKHADKLPYLEVLKEDIERRKDGAFLSMDLYREQCIKRGPWDCEEVNKIVESYKNLFSKFDEVEKAIEEKIATFSSESEYDFEEPTLLPEDKKREK